MGKGLSAVWVSKAREPGRFHDGNGLYLQVRSTNNKSWLFRYTFKGKAREMGLGSYPQLSLADARNRLAKHRSILRDPDNPQDPIEVRKAQRAESDKKSLNFRDAAAQTIESKKPGWSNAKSEGQWRSSLSTYTFKQIGDKPVGDITTDDVLKILTPIWSSKNETASRVRSRIEAVLDFAKAAGHPVGDNPARWKGHMQSLLANPNKVQQSKHFAAMEFEHLPAFVLQLRERRATSARAMEYVILTASRTSEVIGALWSEIDLDKKEWAIPAERMKANKAHTVPLSNRALEILRAQKAEHNSQWVFPSSNPQKPLSNGAMLALLKRLNASHVTVHGFRSTFRDWAGEHTEHAREVIEHALAHQLKDAAEAAYARGTLLTKRRMLMADWEKAINAT